MTTRIPYGSKISPQKLREKHYSTKWLDLQSCTLPVKYRRSYETPEETETLDSVKTKSSKPVWGSEFLAISAQVSTVAEVKNLYSKIIIDPYVASADNRILVYRFVTDDATTHENYHDDYEHGTGRRLRRHTRETHI